MPSTYPLAQQICLACGLCCNGALFKDVQLQPHDNASRLKALGLPLTPISTNPGKPTSATQRVRLPKCPQPCPALLADGQCNIYHQRPARCREFECALLQAVDAGRVTPNTALRHIRATRRKVDKVRRLLLRAGNSDEHLALSVRFRRVRRQAESRTLTRPEAHLFQQLSLAVHQLNLALAKTFYP